MSDPSQTPPQTPSNRPSPALLIFLIFPIIGLVAAVILALSSGTASGTPPTPAPVILPTDPPRRQLSGEPAPDFELRTLDQTTVKLADYRGRVVFLNFWATNCEPCQREMPAFEAFMAQQPDDGPIVLAVNMGETYDQTNAYLTERGISGFPVLLDVNYEVADQYGIGAIPVTYVIDKDGIIRFSKFGEMKPDDLTIYLTSIVR
jgi:peroxiredoxin